MASSIKPRLDDQGLTICDGCSTHFEAIATGQRYHSRKCQNDRELAVKKKKDGN